MKTKIIILLSLWCICTIGLQAQTVCDLQPLKLFGKDTVAFLYKNFGVQAPLYGEGRNLKIFMEDINEELTIKAFRVIRCQGGDCIYGIHFFYYDVKEILKKAKKNLKVYCIEFSFYPVDSDKPLYKEIQDMGIDMNENLMPWDNKYLEVLNKLKTEYFVINEY